MKTRGKGNVGGQILTCFECWAEEFGAFSEGQWGAVERHSWNEDWAGGATAGGREVREEGRRRAGEQKSLETRDKLGALSSVFRLGKSLSLDTSPSGDLFGLVSGTAGESLFNNLMSSWSLWKTGHFNFTTPLTIHFQTPVPTWVTLEMMTSLRI